MPARIALSTVYSWCYPRVGTTDQSRALRSIRYGCPEKKKYAVWLTSETRILNKILWIAWILGEAIILYSTWHIGETHVHNSHSSLSCLLIMFNHLESLLERRQKIFCLAYVPYCMLVGPSLNALQCYEWRLCQDTFYSTDFPPCHYRLEG